MNKVWALALALLVLPFAASHALAATEEPRVIASTYRVDLGAMVPGEERTGAFMLSNPGYSPITVRLLHEGDATFLETPPEVVILPGSSLDVNYTYRVPAQAAPGHHGEALKLSPRSVAVTPGTGTLDAGTAIIFTSRTTAIGVLGIESARTLLPGERVQGAIIVASTWRNATNVTVGINWTDAKGTLRGADTFGPLEIAANGHVRLAYDLPAVNATPGAQTLVATILATDPETPIGSVMEQTFHLGRRAATYRLTGVTDLLDGNASLRYVVENTGDVPVTVTPQVRLIGPAGENETLLLAPVTLEPGERREIEAAIPVPPGSWRFVLEVDGADADVLSAIENRPVELHMRDPEAISGAAIMLRIALLALALALLVLAVRLLWRHRANVRGWIAGALAALPRRRPPADPYDALFDSLEAEERPRMAAVQVPMQAPVVATVSASAPAAAVRPRGTGAALLLDLDGFADATQVARLSLFAAGKDVQVAYAYAHVDTEARAAELHRELAAMGFTPRVALTGRHFHIELTVDAMREARAGRAVLLASHDPAFITLVRALHDDGEPVEVLGLGRNVPVSDQDASQARARSTQRT